ncbi:hypothetical protein [Myxococcus eversor]|uniref:hypothetical protein n=1 Tax=Myxococcus eversor TaxID=2709661 RepID=UPI0013D6D1FD|nr:hypothetical protein [Myxococcus eversor]
MQGKDKETLVKVGVLVPIGILLALATIGIVIGLAGWLLKYGLIALGIYVVFVLTLRWLHGGKKQRDLSEADQLTASSREKTERLEDIDPAVALARFKAEHQAELQQPAPPPRKP